MDNLISYLPPANEGLLPYYLFLVGVVSVGNSIQNLVTLHYTRRIYNGTFVTNPSLSQQTGARNHADSVNKLIPALNTGKSTDKAQDQVTPLTARVFGVWTMLAGIIRIYTARDVHNQALYDLSLITHVVAALHFSSELLVFRTLKLTGPQFFPLVAGFGGTIWMTLQHGYYASQVKSVFY